MANGNSAALRRAEQRYREAQRIRDNRRLALRRTEAARQGITSRATWRVGSILMKMVPIAGSAIGFALVPTTMGDGTLRSLAPSFRLTYLNGTPVVTDAGTARLIESHDYAPVRYEIPNPEPLPLDLGVITRSRLAELDASEGAMSNDQRAISRLLEAERTAGKRAAEASESLTVLNGIVSVVNAGIAKNLERQRQLREGLTKAMGDAVLTASSFREAQQEANRLRAMTEAYADAYKAGYARRFEPLPSYLGMNPRSPGYGESQRAYHDAYRSWQKGWADRIQDDADEAWAARKYKQDLKRRRDDARREAEKAEAEAERVRKELARLRREQKERQKRLADARRATQRAKERLRVLRQRAAEKAAQRAREEAVRRAAEKERREAEAAMERERRRQDAIKRELDALKEAQRLAEEAQREAEAAEYARRQRELEEEEARRRAIVVRINQGFGVIVTEEYQPRPNNPARGQARDQRPRWPSREEKRGSGGISWRFLRALQNSSEQHELFYVVFENSYRTYRSADGREFRTRMNSNDIKSDARELYRAAAEGRLYVDVVGVARDVIQNEFEDLLIGKASQAAGKARRRMGGFLGTTGPAL